MQTVSEADIAKTQELVDALNRHLDTMVGRYPAVEVRTDHGYSIGEYARVRVEFVHGRVTVR